jgi:hypothetical protein
MRSRLPADHPRLSKERNSITTTIDYLARQQVFDLMFETQLYLFILFHLHFWGQLQPRTVHHQSSQKFKVH